MEANFLNRKLLYGTILLLFVILFAFLITDGYFTLNRDVKIYSADAVDIIDQRMDSLLSEVNVFPQYVGDDLMFLSELSSFKKVTSFSENTDEILKDLENDFLNFLKESSAYYQLGYIDKEGNEILEAEREGGVVEIISKENLKNKKDEDYFSKTLNFDKGEIFISQIELNVEDGEIDNFGTEENPIYLPIIFYAIPTFSESGERTGVVFLSYEADNFLDDIRNSAREGETIFLTNEEGYYLAHPNSKKEFAPIFGRDDNIYSDYPEISKRILLDYNNRRFETDDLIFSFKYIYPTAGNFGVHKGSEKIFGENPEESYFWVLVSVSDKDEINKTIGGLRSDYIYFLLFSGLIVFIIVLLIFVAVFKGFDNKPNRRRK